MEGNMLFSKSTNVNINIIFKNTFNETSRMFDQTAEYCGLVNLTHKTNHHGAFG